MEQVDKEQTDGSRERVDEEIYVVAQPFGHPAADSHRHNQDCRDKRNLQHVDGVAVTFARNGADGIAADADSQAKEQLCRHRAKAEHAQRLGWEICHSEVNEGRKDEANSHRPEESMKRIAVDEQSTQSDAEAEGYDADRALGKAYLLHGALESPVRMRII